MIHQIRKTIEILRALDAKFGDTDDGLKALIIEKDLEKLFPYVKPFGCWIREVDDNKISIGHSSAEVTCKKTASNACEITLDWFREDHPNWKSASKLTQLSNGQTTDQLCDCEPHYRCEYSINGEKCTKSNPL